jgi:tRNA threonylcarbamoyladenosine modification (KEOPS) complex Cgi121 subunit
MLQYLREYGKYLEITGYHDIRFDKAEIFLKTKRKEAQQNIEIQFFEAELIATQEHLYFAVLNALQAFKNKTNLSKSIAMETMLYASAQRQIQKAIIHAGIKPQTHNMAIVIVADDPKQIETALEAITENMGTEPDERVLDLTKNKAAKIKKTFKITEKELEVLENGNQKKAITDIIIERIALLSTQL